VTWAPVEQEVAAVVRRSGPSDLPRSVENCQDLSRWSDGMPSASAEAKVQRPKTTNKDWSVLLCPRSLYTLTEILWLWCR
jgi:hypothetical protein